MRKNFIIVCIVWLFFISSEQSCAIEKNCYSNMSEVLGCFLQHNDGAYKYEFVSENNKNPNLTIKTYILYSQNWPIKNHSNIPSTIWKHKLILYIPKQMPYSKAMLYVNGGCNRNKERADEFSSPKEQIDYVNIAINNKAPVIELQDVPNQWLFFDNRPMKEDRILAYTYKMVMNNPLQNAYLAGHLPMAKAIIKAMDASQAILKRDYGLNITGFVLAGASKRGWAVWLASLEDERVQAIAPIVINILNTKKSIIHICKSYGGTCPPALNDYVQAGIIDLLDTEAATKLMQIIDPFSYLDNTYNAKYKQRLAIPKYIINASGDDFFVPDSSKWYFKDLPGGSNYIRYLPNAMHYFAGSAIADSTSSLQSINNALNSYFYFILNQISLPKIHWSLQSDRIELESSIKPQEVKLWFANNEHTRDFRFITSYSQLYLFIKEILSYFSYNICDNCYYKQAVNFNCEDGLYCKVSIPLLEFRKGWQAAFAEIRYNIDHIPFIVTTEVNIVPNTMPAVKFQESSSQEP